MPTSSISTSSRDLILRAARTLISDRGYDGMGISDLSALSGLPASSIYYHFGSKLGVLTALLERTFEDLHAAFPSPSAFDDREPIQRFELWYTSACRGLDERPEYLRLLLAVSIGSHASEDSVRVLVRKIRDYAHRSWIDALTPVFAPIDSPEDEALLNELAVLGRAMTDGLSVATTFDGGAYVDHVPPFVALVRGLAAERRGSRP
ncbi:TetR/AcrR family transcriptional regulator [Nocardiopsis aegyptia]|uniref:AcrR family transcriptional regulator n=1 Tax=Nocardiopsis aegyptia TaxID=220378 RepID=A0A7Z0ENA9_9ACTN|nr:TetR/AcrR family transcriptional regulator [Nocardiopsis aegyptia]NYJ35034.1 AcrR family transcriptional regulator [Nocardiopsis aegyptia]